MCIVSAVHDYGSKLPQDIWRLPDALPTFEDLVKKAEEFDRAAKQRECVDPEKLKFLEEIIAKQGQRADAETDAAKIKRLESVIAARDLALEAQTKQAQENLDRAKRSEAALAAATKENLGLKADNAAEGKRLQALEVEHAALIVAYARLAVHAGLKVSACGSGEHFTQLDVALPTGPVRFFIDNIHANLLAGLPYGIGETRGAYDASAQAKRLTYAYHPDFPQTPIPEPMTADRVLEIISEAPPPNLADIRFGVPYATPGSIDSLLTGAGEKGGDA